MPEERHDLLLIYVKRYVVHSFELPKRFAQPLYSNWRPIPHVHGLVILSWTAVLKFDGRWVELSRRPHFEFDGLIPLINRAESDFARIAPCPPIPHQQVSPEGRPQEEQRRPSYSLLVGQYLIQPELEKRVQNAVEKEHADCSVGRKNIFTWGVV